MKTIEEYAEMGKGHDVMNSLELLTKAYISMCGLSFGFRTVVYCAAEAWLEQLAWMDLPLSEMARKKPLLLVMPHITSEYNPDVYDRYDIAGMNNEELLSCCQQIVEEEAFDEATLEVLCWGIMKVTEEEEELSIEIEATAPDGSPLKGILTEQKCAATCLTMTSPYNDVQISKDELVRDAIDLLVEGYEEYQRLHKMENEIRALYPEYQEELKKRDNESKWRKYLVFHKVYDSLIEETVLVNPKRLFSEWFGLEFYEIQKNFLNEYRGNTTNNGKIVSINENNIKRIISTHSDNGYIVISTCRDGSKSMIDDIKQSGFTYTPIYGSFKENLGTDRVTTVYERSIIVYNKDKEGNNRDFDVLINFGIEMCRKYNQDSFLAQAPGENPKYIKQDGSVDFEFSGGKVYNDISHEYFTDLHKNVHKSGDIANGKPTRFRFNEAYVNPKPQSYFERASRWYHGEVF